MDKNFLKYKNNAVHYLRFGHGAKLLIALHGFADQAEMFLGLEESLKNEYTVYCLDLPFHGLTKWDKQEYDRKDVAAIFEMILKKENRERLDLMGFSLGGRIVQKMLFEWHDKVDKVFLIAPYGLTTNASVVPQWVKSFLNNILQKPTWFIKLIKVLRQVGLINRFHYSFAYHHVHTEERRNRLFRTWRSLHYFKLKPSKVKSLFKNKNIKVELYFGAKDKIIPVALGEKLSDGLPNVSLHVLNTNHKLINGELNELLKKQLH